MLDLFRLYHCEVANRWHLEWSHPLVQVHLIPFLAFLGEFFDGWECENCRVGLYLWCYLCVSIWGWKVIVNHLLVIDQLLVYLFGCWNDCDIIGCSLCCLGDWNFTHWCWIFWEWICHLCVGLSCSFCVDGRGLNVIILLRLGF